MTALDKVLAALDAGLQSSDERGYPDRTDHDALCARCLREERPEQGEICPRCRAYLLGDSDEDPSGWHPFTVEEDGSIHGYITARPDLTTLASRWADPTRWSIAYQHLNVTGEPRSVVHYSANDVHGQYVTDDERPFTVRIHHGGGRTLRAELVNADDVVCHFVALSEQYGGGAIHHRDGNPRNNSPENLDMVQLAQDVARESSDFRDGMRRIDVALSLGEVDTAALSLAFGALAEPRVDAADSTLHLAENPRPQRDAGYDAYIEGRREEALQRVARGLDLPVELLQSVRRAGWREEAHRASVELGERFEAVARRYEERAR